MLRNKEYQIDNVKFRLRDADDLDLDEDEQIQKYFKDFYAADKQTITGNLSTDDLVNIFKIILRPSDTIPEGFNFRKVKRGVATKIIGDFFLNSVFATIDIANSLRASMLERERQSVNTNH